MFQSQPNRHISSRSKKVLYQRGLKCDVFREGCDKKGHKLKKRFSCARLSHSSQKCDNCDASHFLSPEKVTNVTSLTQIWDGNLGRNWAKTDPMYVYIRTYTCIHMYIYTKICIYQYMDVYTRIYIYTYTYIHICILHIYIHIIYWSFKNARRKKKTGKWYRKNKWKYTQLNWQRPEQHTADAVCTLIHKQDKYIKGKYTLHSHVFVHVPKENANYIQYIISYTT